MCCPHCGSDKVQGHGKYRGGRRLLCRVCGKSFTETPPRPLGKMRLPMKQAINCLKMLLEGMSIRSCERLTGVTRNTLCDLILTVGQRCQRFLKKRLRDIPVKNLEMDETWSFVSCKEKTRERMGYGDDKGDAYCYLALERDTKLIVAFHVAKRTDEESLRFVEIVREATFGRFQLSSDGWRPYRSAVPQVFGYNRIDFGQIIKVYKTPAREEQRRYSPPQIVEISKSPVCGDPAQDMICTSHMERGNLSLRMTCRRWTRLTNAHSKSWKHHEAALALFIAFYNWVRPHMTLGTTPAVKHGLAEKPWTLEELLAAAA